MKEIIFKSYDIRGIYPFELDESLAYKLGRAFVEYLKINKVIIGNDMRVMAEKIKSSLISGIINQGADVIDIGMVSTDTLYFASKYFECAGIMITASHNPPEYCGFKMVKKIPKFIGKGSGMEELKDLVINNDKIKKSKTEGKIIKDDSLISKFINVILNKTKINNFDFSDIKIVVDAGNGMGGNLAKALFEKLNMKNIEYMYAEPDGNFPNHIPDPLKSENKKDLRAKVLEKKYDLGIAFDGDADRVFFVDEKGNDIPGDFMTAVLSEYFLTKYKNGKIIYDLRSSYAVKHIINKNKGMPIESRVGHVFIKDLMEKKGAVFGGEVSGHYFYKDLGIFDSAIYTVALFLIIMKVKNIKVSEIFKEYFENYCISGEINMQVKDVKKVFKIVENLFPNSEKKFLDGISIIDKDFHFNLRSSNTEPLIRLNLEAKNIDTLEKYKDIIINAIKCL